jgi:hypothetical protein
MRDDELIVIPKREQRSLPVEGTRVRVQVRANREGLREIGEGVYPDGGTNGGKTWLRVPFEVISGPHKGLWAVFWITIDSTSYGFRSIYRTLTGGESPVPKGELKRLLLEGEWEVELEHERQRDKHTQEIKKTGKATVRRLLHRVTDTTPEPDDDDNPVLLP